MPGVFELKTCESLRVKMRGGKNMGGGTAILSNINLRIIAVLINVWQK